MEEKRRAPDLDGEEDGVPVEEKKTGRQICLCLRAGRARASPASTPDLSVSVFTAEEREQGRIFA